MRMHCAFRPIEIKVLKAGKGWATVQFYSPDHKYLKQIDLHVGDTGEVTLTADVTI